LTLLIRLCSSLLFLFHGTAPSELYTLSLHDALPISLPALAGRDPRDRQRGGGRRSPQRDRPDRRRPAQSAADRRGRGDHRVRPRSEEHTSELQSQSNLVCRLLLEKKKKIEIIKNSDS